MTPEDFLKEILQGRTDWEKQLARLRTDQLEQAGVTGAWTVKDLVAHIAWYEREMVGLLQSRALIGSDLWNLPNDERNRVIYEQNRNRPAAEVLQEARAIYQELFDLLSKLSEEDLNDPQRFAEMPPVLPPWRLIAGNTYIHYYEHATEVRRWLDSQIG